MSGSDTVELQASARLLATTLRTPFIVRGVLLALGAHRAAAVLVEPGRAVGWPSCSRSPAKSLGRYLFFVSVVPKHMAAPYLGSEAA